MLETILGSGVGQQLSRTCLQLLFSFGRAPVILNIRTSLQLIVALVSRERFPVFKTFPELGIESNVLSCNFMSAELATTPNCVRALGTHHP